MAQCQVREVIILEISAIRIKELRLEQGLTQKQVADYLRIDRSNYSKYERGLLLMTPDMIRQICKLYNVSADFVVGITDY